MDKLVYEKLVRFCEYQERCKQDVNRKCIALKLPKADSAPYIAQLEKEGFIDESRYARLYIDSKVKKWGPAKIRQSLSAKGISETIYKSYLSAIDQAAAIEVLTALATRRAATLSRLPAPELRMKLTRYLLGRGYNYADIKVAISKL